MFDLEDKEGLTLFSLIDNLTIDKGIKRLSKDLHRISREDSHIGIFTDF